MNPDTATFLFGAAMFGLGSLVTGLFWAAAVERDRQNRATADRLRRWVERTKWTEARW